MFFQLTEQGILWYDCMCTVHMQTKEYFMRLNGDVVPIPSNAFVRKKGTRNGQVYLVTGSAYDSLTRQMKQTRIVIGHAFSDGANMIANQNYREMYPVQYARETGRTEAVSDFKRIGPYLVSLAIGQRLHLYELLVNVFNPESANFIMDFATYEIECQSNVAMLFAASMSDHVLFSDRAHDDTWISTFFKERLTLHDISRYKDEWIRLCIKDGVSNVWLSIDGSNDDCKIEDVEEAETGHSKSGTSGDIISYMTVVCTDTGRILTYKVYRGGRVDSKELLEMTAYLSAFGIRVEGVILDDVFQICRIHTPENRIQFGK